MFSACEVCEHAVDSTGKYVVQCSRKAAVWHGICTQQVRTHSFLLPDHRSAGVSRLYPDQQPGGNSVTGLSL